MLPAEWLSARRTTMLVLTRNGRFAVTRYPVGELFPSAWDPESTPNQWDRLSELLGSLDPRTIAIETSPHQAHADGLTSSLHTALTNALPDALRSRVVPGGELGIRWLETRLPEERHTIAEAARRAHGILREGLSTTAVDAGSTTTDDLVWWYRQTVREAGFDSWFQPSVTLQRASEDSTDVIQHGDLIHVDFGIIHEDMCTDQQEHAYVLKPGETRAPQGLTDGLRSANRIQDILLEEFVAGRSGNEILAAALDRCRQADLDATIYTHSIGLQGHGAGMTIGMWDQQQGVPGAGDHRLHADTAYSIELMGERSVAEWDGQRVRFMLEQDAWFDGDAVSWLDGRQEDLWLI
jgi:Xaa-Pro aminopeptidase